MEDMTDKEYDEIVGVQRRIRREELAKDLLLKLIETGSNGVHTKGDVIYNVQAAVEYTDALLAELEKKG